MRRLRVVLDESNTGRDRDQPQAKQSRSSRPGQRVPKTSQASGSRASASVDEDGPARPFQGWKERKTRESLAQQARLKDDLDCLLGTAVGRRQQLADQRLAAVQRQQALLCSTLPLRCSHCSEGCVFEQTGSRDVAFFAAAGARGSVMLPLYACVTHGARNVTVNPLQVSCLCPTPVEINKLYALDLVEEFSLLQLLSGVSGHGA